jgi:hypothetical protein
MLQIDPVINGQGLKTFIQVPWHIYRQDPNWVPPLIFEQKQRLTKKNPFFQHARWQAWTAYRNGQPAGRISAQIDQLHLQIHGDKTGYFGMLEAEDDEEIFAALCQTAEDWLREQGMERVIGPFNLSINEEAGLLVEGFDTPPRLMMGHGRPYYVHRIENCGYRLAQNFLAYLIKPDFEPPQVMQRLLQRTRNQVQLRKLQRRNLKQELEILRTIFNDAWSSNWGFVPFTEAEFSDIGEMLALLVDDEFVQIAEIDGKPVAMTVALPNLHEITRHMNGKLLPFGWFKLLWGLKVRYPTTARIPLMGVIKEYQQTRFGPALAFLVIDAAREALQNRGILDVELSWILEGNQGVRNLIETCGGKVYKRYRIYQKNLD